uniref:Uncharacterized protein n=1 Tax=viral metagenome TaxID=1070528 RepID=A0A6H1ZR73_9ZZZZ
MTEEQTRARKNRLLVKIGVGDAWWAEQERSTQRVEIDDAITECDLPYLAKRSIKPDKRWVEDEEN